MARRIARTWSGVVLLVGALVLYLHGSQGNDGLVPAAIIIGTWGATFATYFTIASRRPRAAMPTRLARASLIVPTLGLLTFLPLTLHLPWFALAGAVDDFPGWVRLAGFVTAPTTLVAGVLMSIRASDLATRGEVSSRVFQPWAIFGISILASGPLLLLVVPGILIAITGSPFIAVMSYQATLAARERAELGGLPVAIASVRTLGWR